MATQYDALIIGAGHNAAREILKDWKRLSRRAA
jgi:hypothetical protein